MQTHQPIQKKIYYLENCIKQVSQWKSRNESIVFTNGCFDILHKGHVDYLSKAAGLGQHLIVGLNTDASVRRIKGEERPLQDESSRALILAAFEFTDAIVLFDEDTPLKLIEAIKPDILVKGSDYKEENIVGYEVLKSYGGLVKTIDFLPGYSTSSIINKIKKGSL